MRNFFSQWLFGVQAGDIPETRISIRLDDGEIKTFCEERHAACIIGSLHIVVENESSSVDVDTILCQLTSSISHQAEETPFANILRLVLIALLLVVGFSKKIWFTYLVVLFWALSFILRGAITAS